MNVEEDKKMMYGTFETQRVTNSFHIHRLFIFCFPVNTEKKHQHYLGFHVTNATLNMAAHSWTARNGTGSDDGK